MISVAKSMVTDTAHRLYNYDGKCAHVHGHSYQWILTVGGPMDVESGLVADYSFLKAALKECVYNDLDHALVLGRGDPIVEKFGKAGVLELFAPAYPESVRNDRPKNGKVILLDGNPTAENFSEIFGKRIRSWLAGVNPAITVVSLEVKETANSSAVWYAT